MKRSTLNTRRFVMVALGVLVVAGMSLPATAQTSNSRRGSSNSLQRRSSSASVIVQYRNGARRNRQFSTLSQARGLQQRLRRLGYQTSLRRQGQQFQLSYRQTRFRQRTFTGATALRQATVFRGRLQRLGYETQLRRVQPRPGRGPGAGLRPPRQLPGGSNVGRPRGFPQVVGMSEVAARRLLQSRRFSVRVTSRDGRSFPVTRDFRRDRVNLSIVRGRVVRANIG